MTSFCLSHSGDSSSVWFRLTFFIGDSRLNTALVTFIWSLNIFFVVCLQWKIDDSTKSSFVEQVLAAGAQRAGLADGWLLQALVCSFHTVVGLFSAVKNLSWRGTAVWQGCPSMPEIVGIRSALGLHNCEAVILMFIFWRLTSLIWITPKCTYSFCSLHHLSILV